MTDAHCHVSAGDGSIRELLIGRDFVGVHPWDVEQSSLPERLAEVRRLLADSPEVGVGEIGLDRLHGRELTEAMVSMFEEQLIAAVEFSRPVVLHGAKCWGRVVAEVQRHPAIPSCLFHGFSRSDGLIPDIVRLNGYVSVGPAVLNDHAVNYRELVKRIPADRILVETDRTEEVASECPSIVAVAAKVAELRGISVTEFETIVDRNADAFLGKVR